MSEHQPAAREWERALVEALYPEDTTAAEEERERLWADFELACRDFAEKEGWPATVRALGRAMATQRELIL